MTETRAAVDHRGARPHHRPGRTNSKRPEQTAGHVRRAASTESTVAPVRGGQDRVRAASLGHRLRRGWRCSAADDGTIGPAVPAGVIPSRRCDRAIRLEDDGVHDVSAKVDEVAVEHHDRQPGVDCRQLDPEVGPTPGQPGWGCLLRVDRLVGAPRTRREASMVTTGGRSLSPPMPVSSRVIAAWGPTCPSLIPLGRPCWEACLNSGQASRACPIRSGGTCDWSPSCS